MFAQVTHSWSQPCILDHKIKFKECHIPLLLQNEISKDSACSLTQSWEPIGNLGLCGAKSWRGWEGRLQPWALLGLSLPLLLWLHEAAVTLVLTICSLGTLGGSERPSQLSFPMTADLVSTSHQISASPCSRTLPPPQVWKKSEPFSGLAASTCSRHDLSPSLPRCL